jgi:hypothetical protein
MVGRPEEKETIRGDTAEKRPYQTPVHSLLPSPVSRAAITSPRSVMRMVVQRATRWIRRSTSEGLRHSRTFPQPHSKESSPTYGITRVAASAPSSLNERRSRSELSLLELAQQIQRERAARKDFALGAPPSASGLLAAIIDTPGAGVGHGPVWDVAQGPAEPRKEK